MGGKQAGELSSPPLPLLRPASVAGGTGGEQDQSQQPVADGTEDDQDQSQQAVVDDTGSEPDQPHIEKDPDLKDPELENTLQKQKIAQWLSTQSEIQVYQYDSDRTDCDAPIMELWDIQETFNQEGITILSGRKGFDGLVYSIKDWGCKNYPPTINIISIPAGDYQKAKTLGFRLCKELEEEGGHCYPVSYSEIIYPESKNKFFVNIYKYSDQIQCAPDSGEALDNMEKELGDSKVMVYQRYKAVDGLQYPISCGEKTGEINVYVIEKASLENSVLKGYRECAWLEIQGGGCYPVSD